MSEVVSMSFKAVEWAYQVCDLNTQELAVLAYLGHRANAKQQCFPSLETIRGACRLGRGSVYRVISSIKARGLVVVEPRITASGRTTSSMYTLRLHRGQGSQAGTEKSQSGTVHSQAGTLFHESSSESSWNLKTATPAAVAIPEPSLDSEAKNFSKQTMEKVSPMKLAEFHAVCQQSLTLESALAKARKSDGSYSGARLERLWSDLRIVHKVGGFQGPLTQKQRGQFAHLAKRFKTGPDVGPVMASVLAHWQGFGKYVKAQCAAQDYPDRPAVGFFLQHADLAVAFAALSKAPVVLLQGLKPVDMA